MTPYCAGYNQCKNTSIPFEPVKSKTVEYFPKYDIDLYKNELMKNGPF